MENNDNPILQKKNITGFSWLDSSLYSLIAYFDKGRFGVKEKILFFREFAYMIQGGVSHLQTVDVIYQGTKNIALKEIAKKIGLYLYEGKSLSYALHRLPYYFDQGDCAVVKSGEISGTLPQTLQSLANEYMYVHQVKNKYLSAMLYPLILIIIAIIAVLSLFLVVLPNIFVIADSFQGLELPWITQMLRDTSEYLLSHWQGILILGIIVIVLGVLFFSSTRGKIAGFSMIFRIPVIGRMTKVFYLVKWCRYMKMMLESGMTYIQTFQVLKEILGISVYQDMLGRVLYGLNKGNMIYDTLKYETELIPNDAVVLLKVGEETANLPVTIDNILKLYEEELDLLINRLVKVIEPVMLIFVGGIIVVIALGVFGLILQIMEGVAM